MSRGSPALFKTVRDGISVAVRLTPKASRNAIGGVEVNAEGGVYLKVMVTTVPEDGKANAALCKLLAKSWKIPATSIAVTSGATSRNKQLVISCADPDLPTRLESWLQTLKP